MELKSGINFIRQDFPEETSFYKKIAIAISISLAITLITFFLIPIILDFYVWDVYIIILKIIWNITLYYVSYVFLKYSPIKEIIYLTLIVTTIIAILDIFGQILGWYDTANEFFAIQYDMVSHFFSGFVFFLIFIIFLQFNTLKIKLEILCLILTNLSLFIWELIEEILEFYYAGRIEGLVNLFFWNGIQDIIFNLIGSILSYILYKIYIKYWLNLK